MAVISYKVTYGSVEISLLGLTLRRIPFSNIKDIVVGSPTWNNENWTYRLRGFVTIKKKRGLVRNVVISPDDPQAFIKLVRERMALLGYKL